MRVKYFFLFLAVNCISLSLKAESLSCLTYYLKTLTPKEFTLHPVKRGESKQLLTMTYEQFLNDLNEMTINHLNALLTKIESSPQHELSDLEINKLSDLRKSSSLLRSAFQLFSIDHSIPKDFDEFVVKLGGVKDYLETDPREKEGDFEPAKTIAYQNVIVKIIKLKESLNDIDFKKLISDSKPATRTSNYKYFNHIIDQTKAIIKEATIGKITVDEVHLVRKNLRNILRSMELTFERQRKFSSQENAFPKVTVSSQQTSRLFQITYLKTLNTQLGLITDKYARDRITGTISKSDLVNFPEELLPKVNHFLSSLSIVDPSNP